MTAKRSGLYTLQEERMKRGADLQQNGNHYMPPGREEHLGQDGETSWLGKQGQWLGKTVSQFKTKKDDDIWEELLPSSGMMQDDDDDEEEELKMNIK